MQKTAYELRISDWSSDVCSSDLPVRSESGAVAGILATVVEVTADVLLDRRRRFVSDLEDHLRPLRDALAVMAAACEMLGRQLTAGPLAYAAVDAPGRGATSGRAWYDGPLPALRGPHRRRAFGRARGGTLGP